MKTHLFPLIRPAIRAGCFLGGGSLGGLYLRFPWNHFKGNMKWDVPHAHTFRSSHPTFLIRKERAKLARFFLLNKKRWQLLHISYSAKGPWNKSLNLIFPIKYVIPKSLVRLACLAESDLEDFRYHTSKPFFFRHLSDPLYVCPAPENCPLLSGHLPFGLGLHLKLGKTPAVWWGRWFSAVDLGLVLKLGWSQGY